MADSVTIEINAQDDLTSVLDQISEAFGRVEKDTENATDKSQDLSGANRDLSSSTGQMSPQLLAAGAAVAGLAVAAGAAALAVRELWVRANESIEAFREQDQVNRALERSLRRTGAAGEPLREELDAIGEAINFVAHETMLSDEELSRMSATFLDMSGAATVTKNDLQLLADISAGMGVSGEQAAQVYANALEGQLRPQMARTTALTKEQIEAINNETDAARRAALAQEALASAYGGTASDINGLFQATKNLEDAKGDLQQAIGQVLAESGAFSPVVEMIEERFRLLEDTIDDNREAIQLWIIDAMIASVEAAQGFIERLMQFAPVFSLVVEYIQQVGRNLSIWVSSINIVMRSIGAFGRMVQLGFIRIIGSALDALIALNEFFGRDIPEGVRTASQTINDMGDSIEESVNEQLEKAGDSVDNIRDKFKESAGAMGSIIERSAKISEGLMGARNFADELSDRLRDNRELIGEVADEADRVGTARPPAREEADQEIDDSERLRREQERLEREHRDTIASIRLAALLEEDERTRIILENEAARREIEARNLTDTEMRLELLQNEIRLNEQLARVDEEEHREKLQRIEEEARLQEQARQQEIQFQQQILQNNQQLLGQLDQQISGLGTLSASLTTLSEIGFDNAEAYQAMSNAFQGMTQLGGALSSVIAEDRKQAAQIEAAFNAAAAVGAFAAWASTGFTAGNLGVAAAQHGIAAAQFGAVAGGGGGGSRGASRGASGGSRRGVREVSQMSQVEQNANRPIVINNNFDGTFIEDSNAIARRVDGLVSESARNRFIAGRGREGRG